MTGHNCGSSFIISSIPTCRPCLRQLQTLVTLCTIKCLSLAMPEGQIRHLLLRPSALHADSTGKRYSLRGSSYRATPSRAAAEAALPAAGAGGAPPTAQAPAEFEGELRYFPGSRSARMLHMARRVERTLMSYERTGMIYY